MKYFLARLFSILGHPAALIPAAAWIITNAHKNAPTYVIWLPIGCALAFVLFSVYKARSGQWAHVDASNASERIELNLILGFSLLILSVCLVIAHLPDTVVIATSISGGIFLAAYILRNLAKSSLHVAFAIFASSLLWGMHWYVIGFVLISVVVAWSRVVLERHSIKDIVFGFLIGAIAGICYNTIPHLTNR